MNIEICKRCFGNKNRRLAKKSVVWWLSLFFYDKLDVVLCTIESRKKNGILYKGTEHYCRKRIEGNKKKINEIRKGGINKIVLADKECPYWLEHQLYDWNVK